MDIPSIVASLVSSGIVSLGVARWLATRIVDHRFNKDLKVYQENLDEKLAAWKTELDTRLAKTKAEVEAALHREVEEYLGDKAAERQYRFEARKRLYSAVGPLRFQLIAACVEFANRINHIGQAKWSYSTSLKDYFGRSTVFRLLRLFAISELIERQMAHADFSVDPTMVEILRFKQTAFQCLSSSKTSLNHPGSNWKEQVEHVFHDTLSMIAAAMIVSDAGGKQERTMRFDEFNAFVLNPEMLARLSPIPRIMEDFTIAGKPIFWVRLVALGQLCSAFVVREGPTVGIAPEPYGGAELLRPSGDEFLEANHDIFRQMLENVASSITSG
ncbi:MAG: hypothetical protein ACHQ2F_06765 [Desulfobaccales bacterium]